MEQLVRGITENMLALIDSILGQPFAALLIDAQVLRRKKLYEFSTLGGKQVETWIDNCPFAAS